VVPLIVFRNLQIREVFTARAVMPMFGFMQRHNELRGLSYLAKDPPRTRAFRGIFTAFPPQYIEAVIILRRRVRLVFLGSQIYPLRVLSPLWLTAGSPAPLKLASICEIRLSLVARLVELARLKGPGAAH
jgi:hypothetical protein